MFKFLAHIVTTNIEHNQCLFLYKSLYNIPFALVPITQNTFGFQQKLQGMSKGKKKTKTKHSL